MNVRKVLSPKTQRHSQNKYQISSNYLFPSDSQVPSTQRYCCTSKTQESKYNFSQQQKVVNQYFKTQSQTTFRNSTNILPSDSDLNKNYSSNQSKIHSLLQQLTLLEQDSLQFNSSFRSITNQIQHKTQQQSLKRQVLSNEIIQIRIDLKQRSNDIQLLINMIGGKTSSSKVDKSTDTEESSKSSNKTKYTFARNKSQKRHFKPNLKIFNRV